TAAGCQLSPEAVAASDDYLRLFFRSATGAAAAPATSAQRSRSRAALPSLYDAHWYASTRLEDHQITYTTTDAIIDEYFDEHPEAVPRGVTVAQIRAAAQAGPRAEAEAALALTEGLAPDLVIPLTGYVEINQEADAKLADARELSSGER